MKTQDAILPPPPATRRESIVDTLHDVPVPDPYRWLEEEKTPEVQSWVRAQDARTRGVLSARGDQARWRERFAQLHYLDSVSAPIERGGRYFYSRRSKQEEKASVFVREGLDAPEIRLLDPLTLSDDDTVSLGSWSVSPEGTRVAYKRHPNNADEATLYVRDVNSGEDLPADVIEGAKYAYPSWMPDGSAFAYVWLPTLGREVDEAGRPGHAELRLHRLGQDPARDEILWPALHDPRLFLGGAITRDGRWLIVALSHGWSRTDVFVRDLASAATPDASQAAALDARARASQDTVERAKLHAEARGFVPLAVGMDAQFSVQWWRDTFYVRTDHEAPKNRVFGVTPGAWARERWKELVPEREDTLDDVSIIGDKLVLSYLHNASSQLEVHALDGRLLREIHLPEIGSAAAHGRPGSDELFLSFSSFTRPRRVLRGTVDSDPQTLWAEVEVPADLSDVVVEQIWYPSRDTTPISMFLIRSGNMPQDGKRPVVLYGYGGFEVSLTPAFSPRAIAWIEQGGMYAIPNLRGGGEYGRAWHRAGMGDKKQNVFDDFIAAAEALIARGYTRPQSLAIWGGSNGGLLVGAVMTQRPELFGAVVCSAPLLDMVRYHKFGSGETWVSEYGSAEDPEQLRTLFAYSPYHRVMKGTDYPALLMLTPDSDDRVDPLHARKFTAAVQWATHTHTHTHAPVLMRVEPNAGHGGADRIAQTVAEDADVFTFLSWQLR